MGNVDRRAVNITKTPKPMDLLKEEMNRANQLAAERNGILQRIVETKERGIELLQQLLALQGKK